MRTNAAGIMRTAFLLGVLAGARTMAAPAAVASAARSGRLSLRGTRLGFLASPTTADLLLVFAAGEMIADTLPFIGSRTSPPQLAARLVSGGLCGAAIGTPRQAAAGALAGLAGATMGTFATAAARSVLARLTGRDLPVALVEDACVIAGATSLLR